MFSYLYITIELTFFGLGENYEKSNRVRWFLVCSWVQQLLPIIKLIGLRWIVIMMDMSLQRR